MKLFLMQKFNVLSSDINLYELRSPFEDIVGLFIITVFTSLLFISSIELLKSAIFKLFCNLVFRLIKNCCVFKIPSKWLPKSEYKYWLFFELHAGLEKLYKFIFESYELIKFDDGILVSRIWSKTEYPKIVLTSNRFKKNLFNIFFNNII